MNCISSFRGVHVLLCTFFITVVMAMCNAAVAKSLTASLQQRHIVSGKITDPFGPLPGATVSVKGKSTATVADAEGRYQIEALPSDILVVAFIGYATLEIPISNRTSIDVQMAPEMATLQEVVVNAGYYSVKEKERTGSIASMGSDQIEKQPVTAMLASMQGRLAGVSITQESGVPGGGFSIRIRGQNSLREDGNAPLYVIDGVPYAADDTGVALTTAVSPVASSPLNSISPDDIESIEVLKDADATAIYGSRGANGVVLVTTKKGKKGAVRYSVAASGGLGRVTRNVDLMNTQQYLEMRRQAFANDGFTEIPAYAYDSNGTWDKNRYTDWQDVLLGGAAEITAVQAGASGGTGNTQFLLSGNYHSETTVFPGSFKYQKGGTHFSLNHRSNDEKFGLSFAASYTVQDNGQPGTDLTREARMLAPNAPALYDAAGNLNWENGTWENPLRNLKGIYEAKTSDLVASALLSYKILVGLEFRSSFGFTSLRHDELRTFPSSMYNPAYGVGPMYSSAITNATARKSWIAEPQLSYERQWPQLRLSALAGATFQDQQTRRLVQMGSGFTSNSLISDMASAASVLVFENGLAAYRYQAVFGRLNAVYRDKYILNATGRRDGSSRFGPGNRYAEFGALGAAWLFSKEKLLENIEFLSFGKLRASCGTTGSDQIGDYQYLDTYISSGNPYQGVIGLQPARLYNPAFGWESSKKLELALEAAFFQDRLAVSIAAYRTRSASQLVGRPLPATAGFGSIQDNLAAEVENKGLEITVDAALVKNKNFSWASGVNLTVPKNTLLSFPGLETSSYASQYVVGKSIAIRKLYKFEGLDPETGIFQFTDFNGDGVLMAGDDTQVARDMAPKFYGGWHNEISYKGWTLDFLFQFVKQENFSAYAILGVPGAGPNMSVEAVGSWSQPGDAGPYQRFTTGNDSQVLEAYYRYAQSDAAIADASYVRLKNASLSYDIPATWMAGNKCRVSLQGQNLFTLTPYKGADPEFRSAGYLPPLRIITAGIKLDF